MHQSTDTTNAQACNEGAASRYAAVRAATEATAGGAR